MSSWASPASESAYVTERDVTIPLEHSLLGQDGVRGMRSLSVAGAAAVGVALAPGTDLQAARQGLVQRLGATSLSDGARFDSGTPRRARCGLPVRRGEPVAFARRPPLRSRTGRSGRGYSRFLGSRT